MHKKSSFKIVTQTTHGYIGVCECCQEFNFVYKNILLTFQEDAMFRFFDWIHANRNEPEHYIPLAHGRSRVFSSPNSNLFLVFHDEELEEILRMFNETKLVLEARKALLSNRMN